MKTKDKEITAECKKESKRLADILYPESDNGDVLQFGFERGYEYAKANEKELLRKAYMDGLNNGLTFDYDTPNFETWYNQLKNQKENG